ncbi:MAG TPA: hypothetical protein VMW38_25090 [Terriglobia bacterium]|nr:hypothetical protein [Terriglobia bacterium]
MTLLATAKRRKRYETSCSYRGRHIVVDLQAFSLHVRLKGKRSGFEVPYDAVMDLGAKLADRARRAEKIAKSKQRRSSL